MIHFNMHPDYGLPVFNAYWATDVTTLLMKEQ